MKKLSFLSMIEVVLMDKQRLLSVLEDLRRTEYSIWEDYAEQAKEAPGWRGEFRDMYEMRVRTLDYVMEAIRHDAI